jgi:hypothetical protein
MTVRFIAATALILEEADAWVSEIIDLVSIVSSYETRRNPGFFILM